MNSSPGDGTPQSFELSRAIPLARISMVGAEFAWYHAVAIVRQLVDQLIPRADDEGPGGSIPDIASLSLHANGVLRAEVKPGDSTPPAVALGSLLHHLLANRDQPAVLRLLVLQAGAAAPAISLSELVYQLGQWERPNRRELLTAVYGMLSHIPPTHPGVDSPSAMPVVSPAENVHAPQPQLPSRMRFALRFLAGLAIGGGLILVAVLLFADLRSVSGASATASGREPVLLSRPITSIGAALTAALRTGSDLIGRGQKGGPSSPGADVGDAELVPSPPTQAGNRPARPEGANVSARPPATAEPPRPRATSGPPRPPATTALPRSTRMVSADNEFRRARTLFENHQYAEAVAGFDRVLQTIDDAAAGGSELRWMTNEFLTLGRALAEQEAAVAVRVYTAADGDVVQPVPLGRFLPPPPSDTGADRQCAVEIVIDATGSVESAKLVGSRIGARDYWWVTVAKAWHFQPATKDGRPVKFLMSIPIPDESGLPQ